jgi:serine/threonine-protein kinase
LEWEKAARGIDGRLYPWGDNFDPSWTCMNESHPNEARACSVHSFEIDDSIYGVRGMAGNVRDWCFDSFEENGPLLSSVSDEVEGENRFCIVRGGAWTDSAKRCRLDYRYWLPAQERNVCVGFRLVRPLDTSEH